MTSASELNRLLLFCGHSEVADFLNGSPLNRHLYKHFLRLLPQHQIEVPMVSLFNEIYYQVVRTSYDATPGVDITNRYFRDSEAQLQSQTAAQLVYAVIWALLRIKPSLTFGEECFQTQLQPLIQTNGFSNFVNQLYEEFRALGIEAPSRFPTITCPIDGLPTLVEREERDPDVPNLVKIFLKSDDHEANLRNWRAYSEAWITVTGHFSHAAIERLTRLYARFSDQVRLVEMIQDACPREDLLTHTCYFTELCARISSGVFAAETEKAEEHEKKKVQVQKQDNEVNVEVPQTTSPLSINITIPTAQQVNINPQRVINWAVETDENGPTE